MKRIILTLVLSFLAVGANAALVDRGSGFIYDDVLDITWTQDADINGTDNWFNQIAWADSLSLYDSVRDVTWEDWRLPSMDINGDEIIVNCASAAELACRDNEYGYHFHQNGVTASSLGLFQDLPGATYWSGTDYAPDTSFAWAIDFIGANQDGGLKSNSGGRAWAVMDGDVAASVVPIPPALLLFPSALAGLAWFRRRA